MTGSHYLTLCCNTKLRYDTWDRLVDKLKEKFPDISSEGNVDDFYYDEVIYCKREDAKALAKLIRKDLKIVIYSTYEECEEI